MTRTDELLLDQATHGSQPAESWYCEDCQVPTVLNVRGRCERCDSDAVTCRTYRPAPKRDALKSLMNHFRRMANEMDEVSVDCRVAARKMEAR